jgi:lipopolysaccharide exporter
VTDLHQRMAKGAAWLVLLRVFDRGLGFVSTLILARLLVPADFGLIAMAMAILAALDLLSSFSFDLALIQNQHAERRHYDTAWTFAVLFGVFNGLVMCALAAPAAAFYGEQRVEGVMYALALCCFVQGFDNIGIVAFQKDLQLHKEFVFGLGKKLAGFVVTLALAYFFQSYWALIGGTFAMRAASLVLSYRLHDYRPRFSLAAAGELLHFSKWLLLNNLLIFLNNRGTDFVVGRVSGARELGLYSVAYELANLPTTELVWPIQRAVFPGYARLAADIDQLRRAFCQVIGLVAMLTVPLGVAVGLLAEPLVHVLLGAKWLDAIPLIQALAAFGIIRSLHGPTGSIFLAIGRPRLIALTQCLQIAVAFSLMIVLIPRFGTIGAAWALIAGALCGMAGNYCMVTRLLALSFADLARSLWRPLAAAVVLIAVILAAADLLHAHAPALPDIAELLSLSLTGTLAFYAALYLLWRLQNRPAGAEAMLIAFATERARLRRQGALIGTEAK